jgi:hypothetical protein
LRFYAGGVNGRSVLVYALAPKGAMAWEANGRPNEYVADRRRGPAVSHDHFVGAHGGAVVLDVRSASLDYLAAAERVDPRFCWQGRKP